jgi:potassium efflux system protein
MKTWHSKSISSSSPSPARCLPGLIVYILWLFLASAAQAQPATELGIPLVEQRLGVLRESGSADDSEVVRAYKKVKTLLIEVESKNREAANYVGAMTTAPKRQAEIQARIDAIEVYAEADEDLGELTRSELKARLVVARGELGEEKNTLDTFSRQLAARETNKVALRSRLEEITSRDESLPDDTLIIQPARRPSLAEAQRWTVIAEHRALRAERRAIEARLASQQVRFSAMAVARGELAMSAQRLAREVKELESQLPDRVAEAVDADSMDIQASDPAYALANRMAASDAELRQKSIAINERLAEVRRRTEEIDRQVRALKDRFANARRVADFASDSDELGSILLAYWREMDEYQPADPSDALSREAAGTVIRRIQLEESLKELSSATGYINGQLEIEGIEVEAVSEASRGALVDLVGTYRKRLRSIIGSESDYIESMASFDDSYETLTALLDEYELYLEGLILWIPAYPPLWDVEDNSAPAELAASSKTLQKIRLSAQPSLLFSVLVFALLFSQRNRLQAYQQELNARIARPRDDSVNHTLLALVCVVLRALMLPILLAGIASVLSPNGIADAVTLTAVALFVMQLMQLLCEPSGPGPVHFGWPETVVTRIHRDLSHLIHWWLPLAAVVGLIALTDLDIGEAIIARWALAAFIVLPLILITSSLVSNARSSGAIWVKDVSNQVRLVLSSVLAASAIAILFGHYYSVSVVLISLADTLWIGICLLLLHAVLLRWVSATRRRLRLAELMAARMEQNSPEDALMDEQEESLGDVSAETNELINMGILVAALISMFYVWSPLLPVFDALSNVTLWTSTTVVDGQTLENRISLAMLIIVAFLAGLTVYGARKLPALIDLLLRSRPSISASARYTVSALVNYFIIGGGTVAGLSALGLQWSQLQWLVAALGVGIGFGLQEIIANFISGLIILFERPIRVGDIISTGGNDGTVTRIRIRATTIRDWDGKELLVPNKEFITGRLLNWSLSDPKIRITLPVGIAYGSDLELAIKTLYEIVREHPRIVDDPDPQIVFESFGDNALALSARCFLDSVEDRWGVVTELNREIYKRFGEAGIVIAFPQRDIHLDTNKPIRIELTGASGD